MNFEPFTQNRNLFMATDVKVLKFVLCIVLTSLSSTTSNFCKTVSHHTEAVAWNKAVNNCNRSDYKLFEPTVDNIKKLSSCNETFNNVWVDKFQYLSTWIELYGCYTWKTEAPNEMELKKSRYRPAICVSKCPNSTFFGVQNENCFCVNDTFVENYLVSTSSLNCTTPCSSEPHFPCGGPNAMNLYRRVMTSINDGNNKANTCVKFSCEPEKFALYGSKCQGWLPVLCDNGNFKTTNAWETQLNYCLNNSYPYRYTGNRDVLCNRTKVSWSGVFRSVINETSVGFTNSKKLEPVACFKLGNVNGSYVLTIHTCTNKLKYICVKDENGTLSSTQSQGSTLSSEISSTSWTTTEQTDPLLTSMFISLNTTIDSFTNINTISSNNSRIKSATVNIGVVVAAIVPITVIVCVIVFIVFAKKRRWIFSRLKSRDDENKVKKLKSIDVRSNMTENSQNAGTENHTFTDIFNIGYELTKPLDSGRSQGYEFAKPFSKSPGVTGNPLNNSYEFAVVIKDDDYVYTDTKEGEYDTFQNKDNRKIGMGEGNLYSHTRVKDGTNSDYDTAYGAKENNPEIYDHSSGVVKQKGQSNIDENQYDHTVM